MPRSGLLPQSLHLDLQARVSRGEHTVAAALVALDPLLPPARCHPEAVYEHDGVGAPGSAMFSAFMRFS
jgi:hypothetical protein